MGIRRFMTYAACVAAGACGQGSGHGLADLTGTWLLTPAQGGIDGDPVHLTLTQVGTAITAVFTCDLSAPVGTGTWLHHDLSLSFDFGGGNVLALTGHGSGGGISGTYDAPDGPGTFAMERTEIVLDCANACELPVVPRFVDLDFTELDKIEEISLFRSSAGHDYSDECEDCRSMKHYYAPTAGHHVNGDVIVRTPVTGQVVSIAAEGHGASVGNENKQVRVRSSLHPEITFVFFHVDVTGGLAAGDFVTAGDAIGTARMVYPDLGETAHDFDLAVKVHTLTGDSYVSWFDVVTDALFSTYVARGASARSDFVLTKAARDADPLTCSDESFTSTGVLPQWFVLDPP
jgi:hypothetical protein